MAGLLLSWGTCAAAGGREEITFNRHIAPLVFQHCAPCHRPGQSGPFNLLTYADCQKRGAQMLEVVTARSMPPWPPGRTFAPFDGERRLADAEIRLLEQWLATGSREGAPGDLPPLPTWPAGWELGEPDLVVRMPEAFLLGSSGRDVYRNFVVPIPSKVRRYVRAMELRPGNKSVHHAFLLFDPTRQSRRMDAEDPTPGIPGMSPPGSASSPAGQFASWQPGKTVRAGAADTVWTLEPNTDLVLQMHLQPTGKPESIQAEVAFYFTNTPPTQFLSKIGLAAYAIDIPPGATNYTVQDSFVLPRDTELLGVLPHSHYLGREIRGTATLPAGEQRVFLHIPHWDFRWQGDYRFAQPVSLPAGTRLTMQWVFDNSTNNVFNPSSPPIRTSYGPNTTNEMAELWLRMRSRTRADQEALGAQIAAKDVRGIIEFNTWRIRQDPNDAKGHARLAQALMTDPKRHGEAFQHLRTSIRLNPNFDEAHFALAVLLGEQGKAREARAALETTLRLNPEHSDAHGSLGLALAELGDLDGSEKHLRIAVELNPDDQLAREALAELRAVRRKRAGLQPVP